MPLPELIEIVPLDKPVRAEITVPGSKSITNRALILAALADGEVTSQGALWSEDTQVMAECLQELGFMVKVENDPDEFATAPSRSMARAARCRPAARRSSRWICSSATRARRRVFWRPFRLPGQRRLSVDGVPRMHERPQAALFSALRELGYRVESEKGNDKLPVKIFGEER